VWTRTVFRRDDSGALSRPIRGRKGGRLEEAEWVRFLGGVEGGGGFLMFFALRGRKWFGNTIFLLGAAVG